MSSSSWMHHRRSIPGSRIFYRGEKEESENLGFQCSSNCPHFEELTTLEDVPSFGAEYKEQVKYYLFQDLDKTEYLKIINNVKFLSCGRSHTFLITNNNECFVCGYNAYMQCGFIPSHSKLTSIVNGSHELTVPYLSKVNLHDALNPLIEKGEIEANYEITHACCGWVHSVVIVDSKIIIGAGHNFFHQLGHPRGGSFDHFEIIPFDPEIETPNYVITHVDGGTFFTVICLNSRVLYGAGSSSTCNFGSQDKYTSLEFNKVHEFDCDVAKIQCGYDHTMVLLKDNRIFAVGKLPGASSQLNEYTLITSVPHSPFDRVDIAVSKFNYPSYILVNDILYTLRDTQAEVMVQQKSLIGASLHTTNTHMFVINRDRTSIVYSTLDTLGHFSAPQGFYFSEISGGYTACYAVVKPKIAIGYFIRLKNAYLHARVSDIMIVCH